MKYGRKINLRLSDEMYSEIEELTADSGEDVSSFIRNAVDHYITVRLSMGAFPKKDEL